MTEPLVTRWPVHGDDERAAVERVLRGLRGVGGEPLAGAPTNYWTGDEGTRFEREWLDHGVCLPTGHALAVTNGTTALECALRGVGLHDVALGHDWPMTPQVIVPARTFIATASAVVHAGGQPVVADIDGASLCVTAETLEARRTGATVGVIVVHYAGLPCPDMDGIVRWAMQHGLWIIEDCAHAHGADVGRASHVAAWSFCVGKIMSTGGEGGMVVCLDGGVADRMRAYRDHGRYQLAGRTARDMSGAGAVGHATFDYCVEEFGSNLRMTEMQAAIGRVQLRGLAGQIARRRWTALMYDQTLESVGIEPMFTTAQRLGHARYLYHVRIPRRVEVMTALIERGIPARFGGCDNIAKEPAFAKRGWEKPCPVADAVGAEVFSLPIYPTMSDSDVGRVCDALKEVL